MEKNQKKYEKIDFFNEIILTFTEKESMFSSKKIERFIVFTVFMILTILYISFNIKKMEALQFIEVIGVWLFYGGYNSLMNYRDKKLELMNEEDKK